MKYMLIIAGPEEGWREDVCPEQMRAGHRRLERLHTDALNAPALFIAGEGLQESATATTVRLTERRRAGGHRRTLRRGKGASRRLLPDRVRRPRRGARVGEEDPDARGGSSRSGRWMDYSGEYESAAAAGGGGVVGALRQSGSAPESVAGRALPGGVRKGGPATLIGVTRRLGRRRGGGPGRVHGRRRAVAERGRAREPGRLDGTRVARNKAIDRLRRRQTLTRKTEILEGLERLRMDEEQEKIDPAESPPGTPGAELHPAPPEAKPRRWPEFFYSPTTVCRPTSTCSSSGARPGGAGRADAEDARRALDHGDRRGVPRRRAGDGAADRPRERKIAAANIPYRVPGPASSRSVSPGSSATLYLVFNEGYLASGGDRLLRGELCADAIRLTRLLTKMLPDHHDVAGLLALMLIQDSRRDARLAEDRPVLLPEPGSLALGSCRDRGGARAACGDDRRWRDRPLRPRGGDCGRARPGAHCRRDRLVADPRALRPSSLPRPRARWSSSTARSRWRWRQAVGRPRLLAGIDGLDGFYLLHSTAPTCWHSSAATARPGGIRTSPRVGAEPVQRAFLAGQLSELGDEEASP